LNALVQGLSIQFHQMAVSFEKTWAGIHKTSEDYSQGRDA